MSVVFVCLFTVCQSTILIRAKVCNAPPSGLPNPDPLHHTSSVCLLIASPILLIAFVLQLSDMGDLPDSRRVFDLGATRRQIMDHLCGHPFWAI